ncbi:MAG: hypothetical protein ACI4R8_00640 [Candidatus Caccovivens sp.]
MNKKVIVSLCVVFGLVAVLLILFWTLFGLSSVTVEYSSTKQNLTISDQEIVEAGEFRMGACVLFEGKKNSLQKIENKATENENFAYLRVLNIETVFPNKFVIHVAEREEFFAVEYGGEYLVCDRELKVLKILDNFDSTNENAILLSGLDIKNKSVAVGDFLRTSQENIKKLFSAFLESGRDLASVRGKFKHMSLSEYEDELTHAKYISLSMITFQDRLFVINNIDFALREKLQKMYATESALFSQKTDSEGNIVNSKGEILYVVKTQNGEYASYEALKDSVDEDGNKLYNESDKIALSYSLLANCYIKVDNLTLTDYVQRTEKDIYYSIVEKV